ncbi:extracellular solute-binding protein [Paenibacillus sp. UNC496MF]|uniref:extracellular solute-binding protein n=1 Tax=Paenibacillus sp. UNC496MF TaxID=1502753 RepID=UPI000B805320
MSFDRWNADPFADARLYAMLLQLKLFDKQAWTMIVDTPQWNRVWTDVAGLYAGRVVPSQEDLASVSGDGADLFMTGRVAMAVGGYEYLSDLLAAKAYAKNPKLRALDWEVVPLPAIPENPDIGSGLTLNGLMAIGAKARNPRDAWAFVRYNNSLEVSKLGARSTYRMPARKSLIKPRDGASYDPGVFYARRPVALQADWSELYWATPNLAPAYELGGPLLQDAIGGKRTIAAALAEWQASGTALMKQIKANPDAYANGSDFGGGWGG